ncbi:MAG: hypothetical protein AAGA55_02330 [Planctomycetota bacterium]
MNALLLAKISEGEITIVGILGVVAILIVAMGTRYYHKRNVLREKTRQELAAYVAEGSMTPEDAERLLNAGNDPDEE